ncbi:hypothetical protein AHF37_03236 [Paragonimus kellicotti]|nr:hypothetical protein AHF37_03236 [Paragonimus kellicotti]
MDLLDLPTWLYLRRAHCSSISFKIRWTKLDTHPVHVVIDRVDVEVEALEQPRSETDSGIASYRTGSGKYRLADKVVDGASVLINSVFIHFYAQAFQASVELSRVSLASKTPTWQSGSLKLTSLILPSADAVLIFKELTWDSIRIVADGLLAELNGIPVKLITNAGRIRLTLKKCLSGVDMAATPNGYIKVHFYGFEMDWYPYHLDVLPRPRWRGGHDFREARDLWLSSLDPVHVPYGCGRSAVPVAGTSVRSVCETPVLNSLNLSVIQSVIIMRIADLDISLVSFPNVSSGAENAKTANIAASHFSEELPLSTGLFIGSDKKLHCLPEQTKLLTVELRNTYRSRSAMLERSVTTEQHGMLQAGDDDLTERKRLYIRCAALMPRWYDYIQLLANLTVRRLTVVFVIASEADELFIQLMVPPVTARASTILSGLLSRQLPDYCPTDPRLAREKHVPVDMTKFATLIHPTAPNIGHFTGDFFLTVLEVFESPANFRSTLGHARRAVYRQSFIDPIPLSLWLAVSSSPSLNRPPLELLVDVDCFSNPLATDDWRYSGVNPPSLSTDPVQFYLGAIPITSRGLYWIPSECARLPDALDQLFLLAGLFGELSRVNDQLGLDMVRITAASSRSHATVIHWFCTLSFKMQRCIDFHFTALESGLESEDLPVSREFDVHVVPDSNPPNESTQVPNVQHDSTDCFSSQGFESSGSHLLFLSQEACAAQSLSSLPSPNMALNVQQRIHHADSQSNLVIHTVGSPGTGEKSTCTPHAFIGQQAVGELTHDLNMRRSPNGSLLPDSESVSSEMNSSVDNLSIAGSQDDWLNAYELLSTFDDNRSVDSDFVYEGPLAGATPATASTQNVSCPLTAEEIGTDVLESTSPPLEYLHQLSSDSTVLRRNSLQTISNKPHTRQPPVGNSSIIIRLHHLTAVADTTDNELRFWLKLGQICFSHLAKTTDIRSSHPSPMFCSTQPSSEHSPLWSFFVSIFKGSSNGADHKPYWDSEFSIHANLLSDWSIPLPFPIRHILTQMLSELLQRLRCEYPQWLTGRNGTLSCVNTSPSAIHLQQGLSVVLDKDQIVRLFYEQLQPSLGNNVLRSADNADQTRLTHDSALKQCLVENEHLKFEVRKDDILRYALLVYSIDIMCTLPSFDLLRDM